GVEAGTVGGTVDAVHAEVFQNETVGVSDGTPGQRFQVVRTPILTGTAAAELEVGGDEGWEDWFATGHFASSAPEDKHFRLDAVTGEVCFGPAVREPDGSMRQYGAVPPAGSAIRLRKYVVGGGRKGNVAKGAIRTLKTAIPFIAAVENRRPAVGGIDGETVDEAKVRGPILLRTRNRAVTAEDFEQITREAAPEIARVRCVPAGSGPEAGSVKVLVVPAAPMVRGKIRFEDLLATEDTMQKIQERLEQARLVGTRVLIEPPLYRGVTVVAMLKARPRTNAARIRDDALERLESYFNPLIGGPEGKGWPWGRPVQAGEAYAALQEIRGVDLVEEIRVFGANPVTGERGQAATRIEVEPTSLVFSYEHQVRVQEA
ncbi:MAG TPA: putative baseplate assembly protein, partial [Acidimicrobiales bacterium]